MCGVLAAYNHTNQIKFEFALKKLLHRGPDGYQIKHDNLVSLGHTRLSIVDLSENGDQPMKSGCGRYTITFNGEIYNFLTIKNELISHPYPASIRSGRSL